MPDARIGKAVHMAIENSLKGDPITVAIDAETQNLEPEELHRYQAICSGIQPFVQRIHQFRITKQPRRQLIEHTLAIREDGSPTVFYAGDAFFRGVLDLGFLYGDANLAIVDHKTGEPHRWQPLREQLEGYASLATAHFRSARRFWLGVHWVAHHRLDWDQPVSREHARRQFFPRLFDNIEAAALAVDDGPRANPSAWCGRCNYRSICPTAREARYQLVEDEIDLDFD